MKCTLFIAKCVDFKSILISTSNSKLPQNVSIYTKDKLSAGGNRRGKEVPAIPGWGWMGWGAASHHLLPNPFADSPHGREQQSRVLTRHCHKPESSIWTDADKFQQKPVVPSQWNLRAKHWVTRGFPQRFILGINLGKDCNQKQEGSHNLLVTPS